MQDLQAHAERAERSATSPAPLKVDVAASSAAVQLQSQEVQYEREKLVAEKEAALREKEEQVCLTHARVSISSP